MSLTYEVRPDVPLVTIVGSGTSAVDEVVRLIDAVAQAASSFDHFSVLADMRQFQYGPPLEEARAMANAIRSFPQYQRARIAVLCPDLMQLGLARFVAAIASQDGIDIEGFRDASEAEAWLAS